MVVVNEPPVLEASNARICSETSQGEFNLNDLRQQLDPLTEYTILFYESTEDLANNNPIISNLFNASSTEIFAVATNPSTNCETTVSVPLVVNELPNASPIDETYCVFDPIIIDLEEVKNQVNTTQQVEIFPIDSDTPLIDNIELTESARYIARVTNPNGTNCVNEVEINYTVTQASEINEPRVFACTGDTIRIGNIEITETGIYTIEDETTCITTVYDYDFQNCENVCTPRFPEVFMPNGNGRNDIFQFNTPALGDCVIIPHNLKIYNRWGELIYEGVAGWNGSNVEQGVYIYQFTYSATSRQADEENVTVTGSVTLLR